MPKIFLIKNRLHQQQLKLLESQNAAATKVGELNAGLDQQPLSLIVQRKDGKCYFQMFYKLLLQHINCFYFNYNKN